VKPGSIQNIVLSKTLQTTVNDKGNTKKIIIKIIGILNNILFLEINIKYSYNRNNPEKQGYF
jgi:hypothetical protein|tara:strand:+ start:37 stop:222 length:186 start_codon:yes stop_codon:yes gene_type:complete